MDVDDEIERLLAELELEQTTRDALKTSSNEIKLSVFELDKKITMQSSNLDNEWKDKYDQQHRTNDLLVKQLTSMKDKMQDLIQLDVEDRDSRSSTKISDADLRMMWKQLERDKRVLEGQLKDYEWRLDSESQELAKLNEEKYKHMLVLHQKVSLIPVLKSIKKTSDVNTIQKTSDVNTTQKYYGIPNHRRIIDARKGPVKKMAAVKLLPKLKTSSVDNLYIEKHSLKSKYARKTKSSGSIDESFKNMARDSV